MPPANRHNPRRAKSSTSDYSVTEFPDDAREYAGHRVINHSAGSYVTGDIYTNTIEGFFGNLKTGMPGTYKQISGKLLQSYLEEYAWRYNNRRTGQRSMLQALVREAARR